MKLTILGMILMSIATMAFGQAGFKDLGIGAPVSESRGFVALQDAQGRNVGIVLATDRSPRGYFLVVDLDSGQTEQVWFPEGVVNSDPFASMLSKNGRLYTGAGPTLLEFDPTTRKFLYGGVPNPNAGCFVGEAFADGPGGIIYIGTYPDSKLYSYDPQTHETKELGRFDPVEQYLSYLAVDSAGWVYAGIGTARWNIVAMDPKTGETKQIVPEGERKLGTAVVWHGVDGRVYGLAGQQYYRMFGGQGEKIAQAEVPAKAPSGAFGWGVTSGTLPDKRVAKLNLPERYVEVTNPATNETRRVSFTFESGGAQITSLVQGPDGNVYGSSAHPMHFCRYEPGADRLTDMGPVKRVGGGNFCAMTTQGQYVVAASYAYGIFHLYDTKRPFNGGFGDDPNPFEIAEWHSDICRPRAVLAHPDGEHVLMAGFAGYGMVGGGLGIGSIKGEPPVLITHENLIPNESTVCLRALADGTVIGGTSVGAPGGGHVAATEGTLWMLDWATKKVSFRMNPVKGASEIQSLEVGSDGMVYGLTSGSKLFVFDPKTRTVVNEQDLSQYGGLPRPAMVLGPDKVIYAALSKAILKIEPGTYKVTKLAEAPMGVSSGLALVKGRLYFASGARVWSYEVPGLAK
ncbi:MAG: hypothetical protein ABFD96_00665 [Armatimonadia bacterium]